jgi:hypothetical protein
MSEISKTNNNQMEEYNEFRQFGKETPYTTPTGFFETFSEKTLQKAITRKQNSRKIYIRRLIFSAAASIALLVYSGIHFIWKSDSTPAIKLIVQDTLHSVQPIFQANTAMPKERTVIGAKKTSIGKEIMKKIEVPEKAEALKDVLTDLTDEELQQIAAMYKTDPFINESIQ